MYLGAFTPLRDLITRSSGSPHDFAKSRALRESMGGYVLIPGEAAPRFWDDAAPRNGMMPPPAIRWRSGSKRWPRPSGPCGGVGCASPTEGRMKPNLAAQLAAAETELACLKLALAQIKEDRDELRQERDDWRREAEKIYDSAEKLREADEGHLAPPEHRPWWRRLAGG